jgi:hypothetical protein
MVQYDRVFKQPPAIAGSVALVNTGRMQMRHLLGIEGLNPVAVTAMLNLAENNVLLNRLGKLPGKVVETLKTGRPVCG